MSLACSHSRTEPNEQGRVGGAWFVAAAITFLAGVVCLVATLGGSGLVDSSDDVPLLVLGVADVISVTGWWRDHEKRSAADEGFRLELERCSGTQFDPEVVSVFVEEVRRRSPAWRRLVLIWGTMLYDGANLLRCLC